MKLIEMTQVSDELAEMVALFRVELHSYKGIASKPNIEAGREETEGYLSANFPVFAALVNDEYAGYVVCRIDSEVVWVESMFRCFHAMNVQKQLFKAVFVVSFMKVINMQIPMVRLPASAC